MQTKEKQKDTTSKIKKPRGRTKRPLESIHINTPKQLIKMYKKLGCNQLHLSNFLKVNNGYLNRLMKDGIEPTDKTEKGQDTRIKLFLPRHKKVIRVKSDKPKIIKPDFIVAWHHLPTDERHQVIKEYLKWKNK